MDAIDRLARADTELKVEWQMMTPQQFLGKQQCAADVLVFPSRLLGELVHRQWIVRLPGRLQLRLNSNEQQPEANDYGSRTEWSSIPAGQRSAISYAGVQYGLPLGYSSVSLVRSPNAEAVDSWSDLASELQMDRTAEDSPPQSNDGQANQEQPVVDVDALVDRFLTIAIGQSQINAKYGILFDVRTMKSRLTADEFVFAAQLMKVMAGQPEGLTAVLGSHAQVWAWVQQHEQPVYALVSATELPSSAWGLDHAVTVELPEVRAWNNGAGIMVALATDCRQSARSQRLIEWLAKQQTLVSLRPLVPGVATNQPAGTTAVDRMNRAILARFADANLSCEPRIPRTEEYRHALAEQLARIVMGKVEIADGLKNAAAACDVITQRNLSSQRQEYEMSLGLTL
ncbi:MAG: hypothetical protein KF752_01985 [Pirellulaceae bacterium]|nr:hypothetical protein [Pirellulaceae bacterium]